MSNLARAIEIAASAHLHQTRKNGSPYVLHPLRLMFQCTGEEQQIVAVLHDVVEDSDWTMEQIKQEGFSEEVVTALKLVTHEEGVPYEEYVMKIAENPIARAVKMADLQDNINLLELPELSENSLLRVQKYHRAWNLLQDNNSSS